MQDLADELKISKVTVSKALNGKPGVSEQLKEKIFRLADRYEYMLPDYGQRRLKKVAVAMNGRFHNDRSGKFYMDMYEHILAGLREASCTGLLVTPSRASLREDLAMLDKQSFDGLILLGILDAAVRDRLCALALPKVFVDLYDETGRSDSVVTENIYSAYEATMYLISMGHRDIGFVGTTDATHSITDRYLGWARALIENKLPRRPEWIIPDRDERGRAMEPPLPTRLPTAFMCNCDETAFRLIKQLRRSGIRVPEDISVAGFDDDIYAALSEPSLTTVAVDTEEIGRKAAGRMLRRMENPAAGSGEVLRVPGRLIVRDSVRRL